MAYTLCFRVCGVDHLRHELGIFYWIPFSRQLTMQCIKSIFYEMKYILYLLLYRIYLQYITVLLPLQSYLSCPTIRSVCLKGSGRIVQGMHHPREALSQGSKIQDGTFRTHC